MDDPSPDLRTFGELTSLRRTRTSAQRPSRLGQMLREARQASGLDLEDLAETTNLRLSHLEALEAGYLSELPGDPHGKNFVRRYAQAVGLDSGRALILYTQERRSLIRQDETVGLELLAEDRLPFSNHPQLRRLARLLVSLLLVAAAIWLALRAFDGALTPTPASGQVGPLQTQPRAPATETLLPGATSTTATKAPAPAPTMILLSLQTTPAGAEVSIDGYRFGQSPISDAPVRAGNRVIKIERGGYGTFERTLDLSRDRRLNVTLRPKGEGKPTVTGMTPASTRAATPQTAAQVVVMVSAEAWLEVYRGRARAGERLVYETAEPGSVYTFTAPVYVFSGNAGGVSVAKGEAPAKPLGASGAVIGAAY